MTLSLTMISPTLITQVSDRRVIDMTTGHVVDDEANKAVVLASEDGTLAVTFCGVGRVGPTRVDLWLAESLHRAGTAELSVDAAAPQIAQAATSWFRDFPHDRDRRHTFVVAGWKWPDSGDPQPVLRFVTNRVHGDGAVASAALDRFRVVERNRLGTHVTGYLPAVTRPTRRRIKALLKRATTADEVERTFVQAIRQAADNPEGGTNIGRQCLAVSLTSRREATATYYSEGLAPEAFGPHFVWYSGGRNVLVADPAVAAVSGYRVGFGGAPAKVILHVGGSARMPPAVAEKAAIGFDIKLENAKHRTSDKIQDINLLEF